MRRARRFLSRAGNFVSRRRGEDRLREEIEEHLALQTADNIRSGMTPEQARREAILKFGGAAALHDEYHETQGLPFVEDLIKDMGYALRVLSGSPGFTTVAILTIALGIGATTAIFSVVDATLLHPLPYPHPEQLVSIVDDLPGIGSYDVGITTPEWWDLERSGVFQFVSPVWYDDNNLTGPEQPKRVSLLTVAPNYFALLGVKPQLGTTFDPADRTPGYNLQVVISDGLWKRAFGGDPRILGKQVRLDTDLYQIIGVMPSGFHHPGRTVSERNVEVWPAMGFAGAPAADPPTRKNHMPGAIGRLKPGLTIAAAQAKIDTLVASLRREYPADYPPESAWRIRLEPLQASVAGDVGRSLYLLLGAVGLVLLIGCVNIANLLLARASARGRELAIRQALGAAQSRLSRQLLTESLLLSLIGGCGGMAILFASKPLLVRLIPDTLPRLNEISINWTVLLAAFGASMAAGAIFGLAPVLHARKLDITHTLKQEGRSATGGGDSARMRRALVVTEFAFSVVLMIAAGLLLRSFWSLAHVCLGFDSRSAMVVRTRLPYPNDPKLDVYRTAAQQAPLFREILRRCAHLPGVEETAFGNSTAVPLDHAQKDQILMPLIMESSGVPDSEAPQVDASMVTPEYFHLMRLRLLRGRLLNEFDNANAPHVAVINESMAQTFWPGRDPLGKRVKLSRRDSAWTTIVGIVADARTESLESPRVPQIYAGLYQKGSKHLAIFLRGRLDAGAIPEQVREQVHAVDTTIPVFGARPLGEIVSTSLARRRFSMEMVALFAAAALLLASLGIYGVISYMVNERAREIGIRLALGAHRRDIRAMVLRQGMGLALAGAALGLAGALVVSRLMAGLLYGVSPLDPWTFCGAPLVFTAVAFAACALPARRAVRVNPLVTLRYE